jgi:hypothetical protein
MSLSRLHGFSRDPHGFHRPYCYFENRDVSIPSAAPQTIADLNRIPIRRGGITIYIEDVAWVRNGFPSQTNIWRVSGQRSVLLTIQKAGNASTLNVILGIKALLPQIRMTYSLEAILGAPVQNQVLYAYRIYCIERRQALRLQRCRIQIHRHLMLFAAIEIGHRCPRDELCPNEIQP